MERDLTTVEWEEFYSTGKHNLAEDFYAPAIQHACLIERAVGYFRSTAYLLLYNEIVGYLESGGRIRLVCSPLMRKEDIKTLTEAATSERKEALQEGIRKSLISDVEALQATEDGALHVQLLAGMLKFDMLEIKIALTSEGDGIFHEKIGVIHDPLGHKLSFSGSANETICGWGLHGNVESFDVFCDWQVAGESRVQNHQGAFLEAWHGHRPGVITVPLDKAVRDRLLEVAPDKKGEVARIARRYQKLRREVVRRVNNKKTAKPEQKGWPSGRVAERHQSEALTAWRANGYRGIFKHATGSGKTFTALHALKEHVESGHPALVLVPSDLLFEAWQEEILTEIPDATLLPAGSGHAGWKRPLRVETFTRNVAPEAKHVILATMQTASSSRFRKRLKKTDNMLVVADEMHALGSDKHSSVMLTDFGKRLGLSATPERFGDPEGTEVLMDYFGGVIGGEFTLADALKAGRLVPYKYNPLFVSLTSTEREQWAELTQTIRRLAAMANNQKQDQGGWSPTKRLKQMLIDRARIAKKAHNKIEVAVNTLREHYEKGQHWLVYCEDQSQIETLTKALRQSGFDPMSYHSSMQGDAKKTLQYYIDNGGIMIAIRCLDEGVDIPCISHAVILASSQNPRQFIQRRGRVLRVAPMKTLAHIWDTLVLPTEDAEDDDTIQDALTRSEILRSMEFAYHATNQKAASELRGLAVELGIDLNKVYDALEDDDMEVAD